jgi:outer membrane immunogenic protein
MGVIMKKLSVCTVVCAALVASSAANAADMSIAYKAPQPVVPGWTGFYFGVDVGGAWTNLSASSTSSSTNPFTEVARFPTGAVNFTSTGAQADNSSATGSGRRWGGVFADLMLGYSARVAPEWVAGIQVEGGVANVRFHGIGSGVSSSSSTFIDRDGTGAVTGSGMSTNTQGFSQEFAAVMRWSVAAMARLGWLATPTTLIYGTAGATYAGFGGAGFDFDSFHTWGPSVGGGVEQKLGSNWSIRGEYRFTKFRQANTNSPFSSQETSSSTDFGPTGAVTGTTTSTFSSAGNTITSFNPDLHTIRVAVIYAFSPAP